MDRREFLTLNQGKATAVPQSYAGIRQIFSGLNPYSGPWTAREVAHLLKRTQFGAKKIDIDYFKAMTPSQAVDALLTIPATPPTPPVKNYDNNGIPPTDADYYCYFFFR